MISIPSFYMTRRTEEDTEEVVLFPNMDGGIVSVTLGEPGWFTITYRTTNLLPRDGDDDSLNTFAYGPITQEGVTAAQVLRALRGVAAMHDARVATIRDILTPQGLLEVGLWFDAFASEDYRNLAHIEPLILMALVENRGLGNHPVRGNAITWAAAQIRQARRNLDVTLEENGALRARCDDMSRELAAMTLLVADIAAAPAPGPDTSSDETDTDSDVASA